jgi:pimeloyl-ACP methyl ester carboxylesterase
MEKLIFASIQWSLRILGWISPSLAGRWAANLFTTPKYIERPGWEKELIAKGRPFVLKNGLHAWSWGQRENPKILLVHGWQGRGTQLGKLIDPLIAKGFQVIALDGPAHGDSPGKKTNVKFFADALMEVDREIGPFYAFVAHSFGAGATAIALSSGLKLQKVILVASPADLRWVRDDYCRLMNLSPGVGQAFQDRLEKWAGIKIKDVDIAKMGTNIEIPALIVHDPEDKEIAFHNAEIIAEHWKTARLLVLHGVGHRRILKSPEFIKAAVEFLGPTTAKNG